MTPRRTDKSFYGWGKRIKDSLNHYLLGTFIISTLYHPRIIRKKEGERKRESVKRQSLEVTTDTSSKSVKSENCSTEVTVSRVSRVMKITHKVSPFLLLPSCILSICVDTE